MQYVTFINALKFCHEKIRTLIPITSSKSVKSAESVVSISEFRLKVGFVCLHKDSNRRVTATSKIFFGRASKGESD